MSDQFELDAEVRRRPGERCEPPPASSRRPGPGHYLRWDKDPSPLTMIRKDLEKALENEAYFSHVLTSTSARARKSHSQGPAASPGKERVMHADFLRVDDKVAIKVSVPIHFLNEENCHGVKMEGGMIQHQAHGSGSAVSAGRHPRVHRSGYARSDTARSFTCLTSPCRKAWCPPRWHWARITTWPSLLSVAPQGR